MIRRGAIRLTSAPSACQRRRDRRPRLVHGTTPEADRIPIFRSIALATAFRDTQQQPAQVRLVSRTIPPDAWNPATEMELTGGELTQHRIRRQWR